MSIVVGTRSYFGYQVEDAFKDSSKLVEDSTTHIITVDAFGIGQRLGTMTFNRDYTRVYTVGSRLLQAHIPLRRYASISAGFRLGEKIDWLNGVLWYDSSTGKYVSSDNLPKTLAVAVWYGAPSSTGEVPVALYKLRGVVVTGLSMNINSGDIVSVTLNGTATGIESDTWSESNMPSVQYPSYTYTFAGATVTGGVFDGAYLDNIRLTINPQLNPAYVLGSDTAELYYPRNFIVSMNASMYMTNTVPVQKLYGNEDIGTVTIQLVPVPVTSGGQASSPAITIEISDIVKVEQVDAAIPIGDAVKMGVNIIAKTVSVSTT